MAHKYYDIVEPNILNTDDIHGRYLRVSTLIDKESKEKFLETWRVPEIPVSTEDVYHTVLSNEAYRPDILANTYYNNPMLWWAILVANGIRDPFQGPTVGQVIRIPSIYTLYSMAGLFL